MIDLTVDDLKKKQSVRATFKLPHQTILLLNAVARQLGIKQKSLFDQLVKDPENLTELARRAEEFVGNQSDRRQKTFVISRDSLLLINKTVKKENISRDLLVEASIGRLLPIIDKELETHRRRKSLLAEMKENLRQQELTLRRAEKQLGGRDLLFEVLEAQVQLARKNILEMDALVERGAAMEDWC